MRIYNARLGRFLSVDPLFREYPWNCTYAFAENDPINFIDLDGCERTKMNPNTGEIQNGPMTDEYIKSTGLVDPSIKPDPNLASSYSSQFLLGVPGTPVTKTKEITPLIKSQTNSTNVEIIYKEKIKFTAVGTVGTFGDKTQVPIGKGKLGLGAVLSIKEYDVIGFRDNQFMLNGQNRSKGGIRSDRQTGVKFGVGPVSIENMNVNKQGGKWSFEGGVTKFDLEGRKITKDWNFKGGLFFGIELGVKTVLEPVDTIYHKPPMLFFNPSKQ